MIIFNIHMENIMTKTNKALSTLVIALSLSSIASASFAAVASGAAAASTGASAPRASGDGKAHKDPMATPGIDKHIQAQTNAINKAEQNHRLTPEQGAKYRSNLTKINSELAADKADGKVTKDERQALRKELHENSKGIRQDVRANAPKRDHDKDGDKKQK
jgi:Spy/CpxP family protein refolding chaperone